MSSYLYGRDTLAHESLAEGRRLAQTLGLMGIPAEQQVKHHLSNQKNDPRWIRMASHVGWGVYSWLSAHCFYYNSEPIRHPPSLSPPKTGNTSNAAVCQFWTITQEVAVVYLAPDRLEPDSAQPPPLAFAEEKYRRLLAWSDAQPPAQVTLQSLLLQCWFHCTVVHIFRPFVDETDNKDNASGKGQAFGSFAAVDGSPVTAFDAFVQQLKHLLYTYLFNVPRIL